ncbi:MAG TPA: pirin family protein [Verrucomicrobiae bacterium]|nr:pirin family protein [Verrucomicrobiae bacterium]
MIKIRRANERGHANHGWLDSYHTFSFANYYEPQHMGFRSLRVINDERVLGGHGFPTHPHQDFEIISYVLSGALKHEDSMGHAAVMKAGDVQRISAGTGIAHSEYNNSGSEPVHFLQIWVLPSRKGFKPGYAQQSYAGAPPNALTLVCSPDGGNNAIKINQDVNLFTGKLAAKGDISHTLGEQRHAWIQLLEGDLDRNGEKLLPGDGAAMDNERELNLVSEKGAHFLLFDLN